MKSWAEYEAAGNKGSLLGQIRARSSGVGPTLFTFGFSIAGEQQINTRFSFIADRATNFQPLFASDEFKRVFIGAEIQQFESEGASGAREASGLDQGRSGRWAKSAQGSGGKWAPLSGEYAAWKQQHYPGTKILVRTGALYCSLVGGTGNVYLPSQKSVTFGTTIPYAIYHQTGTKRMPRRRPIQLGRKQLDQFRQLIKKWLLATGQDYRNQRSKK